MFTNLFSPLTVGPVTIRNRVVSSGHDTLLVDTGIVNDALIAYHVARADGGVGLVITQVADVDPEEESGGGVLQAWNEDCVPGFARLADELRARGTTVFAQLHHGGRETHRRPDGTLPVTVAPSAVPNERFLAAPRALDVPRIRRIVTAFGSAADRMRRAGLDGVEVVASHGYLPAQFLNPQTNRRDDEYGGDAERRLRFLREVLLAVRAGAGPALAVGLRISIDDESHDGVDPAVGARRDRGARRRGAPGLRQRGERDVVVVRRLPPHRPLDASLAGLRRSARGRREGARLRAGHGRGPHQPAAGGRGDPRRRPGRRVRDDPRAHLRPVDARQGRGRSHRRHPRLHRLQPGVHRALPHGYADLLHPAPRDRARAHLRRPRAGHDEATSGRRGRRARRSQGSSRRGAARARRGAARGGGEASAARRCGPRRSPAAPSSAAWSRTSSTRRAARAWRSALVRP